MSDELRAMLANLKSAPGASEESMQRLEAYTARVFGARLPSDYLEFLRFTDGAAGPLGESGYVALWPADDLPENNDGYGTPRWMPGFFLIGSDGGNTAYGIDTRSGDSATMSYVETDFIVMGWEYVFWSGPMLLDLLRHVRDDD
jgi:hypothetical protein